MSDALNGLLFFARFANSFSRLGYRQRRLLWDHPPLDFSGQRWLVTGASGGIGRAITEGAAGHGAHMTPVARTASKLEALGLPPGSPNDYHAVDLSLVSETRRLLDELSAERDAPPIDVLVNNVGVLLNEHQLSDEGHELSFATNLLNHFVLTTGLIERGLLAEDAVVINMSSGGMYNVPLCIAKLDELDAGRYNGVQAYAFHKRAQVSLSAFWRQRYADSGYRFYAMHPGWVDTDGVKTSLPGFRALFQHVLRDAVEGADTALWLAAVRPGQKQPEAIWFDRGERNAYLSDDTRRGADAAVDLVEFLEDLSR